MSVRRRSCLSFLIDFASCRSGKVNLYDLVLEKAAEDDVRAFSLACSASESLIAVLLPCSAQDHSVD